MRAFASPMLRARASHSIFFGSRSPTGKTVPFLRSPDIFLGVALCTYLLPQWLIDSVHS